MANNVSSRVLDNGLTVLDTEASNIYICSAEPTTYTEASATYALGTKAYGAGGAFAAPSAGSPNGRKVASTATTDGMVTTGGTATHWAVTDNANSRLLAVGSIAAPKAVSTGQPFGLPSFNITLPSQ